MTLRLRALENSISAFVQNPYQVKDNKWQWGSFSQSTLVFCCQSSFHRCSKLIISSCIIGRTTKEQPLWHLMFSWWRRCRSIKVSWDVMPCGIVGGYQCSSKMLVTTYKTIGIKIQNTTMDWDLLHGAGVIQLLTDSMLWNLHVYHCHQNLILIYSFYNLVHM
jgi:hypothetical protein